VVELRLLTDAEYSEELDVTVDELIDQYVRDEVAGEEREQFERYFLKAPERRDKLRFALALRRRISEPKVVKPRPNRLLTLYLPVAASVLLVAGLGIVAYLSFIRQSDVSRGLAALHTAYSGQRPLEGRVSDFDYAPAVQMRGAERSDSLQRDLAASLLLKAVAEHPTTDSHRALGEYYLAGRQFEKAAEQFEKALSLDPNNAKTHNDLGVALMERGKDRAPGDGTAMQDFGESLEHLNKALELDKSLLDALFNRALLHQYMLLPAAAVEDWRAYLARDPDSKWAEEARQRLKELEQQKAGTSDGRQALGSFWDAYEQRDNNRIVSVINRSYTSAGNTIANALVDAFLDADARGAADEADDKIQALAYIGRLQAERAGDNFAADLAQFYQDTDQPRRRSLSRARGLVKKSYDQYLHSELEDALIGFSQAKSAFDGLGDEYESVVTQYLIGLCYILRFDIVKSEPIIQNLLTYSEGRGYTWLQAQGLYRLAMLRLHANKYSESIEYGRRALAKMESIGDVNGSLKVLIILADEHQSLNDEKQSLGFLRHGLLLAGEASPEQLWGMYTALGLNFGSLDMNAAALEYHREALGVAQEMGRPIQISRSHSYLGMAYGNLGDYDAALAHIGQALKVGGGLSGEVSGQEMMADTSLYAGEIYRRRGEQDKAVEAYDRAINFYARQNFPYFNYTAHKGKLLALLARDNDPSAEAELQTVLGIFERYRVDLTGAGQRNIFFDVEQGVYDRAIDFAYGRKKDVALAFDYSELSRARSLLDALRKGGRVSVTEGAPELRLGAASAPLLMSEVQQKIPEQVQILQYAVLDDKVLAWRVTKRDVIAEEIIIDARTLEDKVRQYIHAVDEQRVLTQPADERAASELYDILIRPFESRLDKAKLLCVVPDKILNYLPFASLIAGATKRYLVEDYRLVTAPSSTVFVECTEGAGRKSDVISERLLSVGNPSFDRGAFALLPTLRSAESEARALTTFYKSSRLLVGEDASEKTVRSEAGKSDVVNLALHYVVDGESNMLSGMALAGRRSGDESDDGYWQVYEIYDTELTRTRLVVLSACQTGIERQYRGEGAVGAARPFIALGVPAVVASLWPVDSDSTSRLIVSFHRHRTVSREPTADALRAAQLELLRGDDERYRRPYYWAAFTAIGGYTEF
jgi:CHAT domain-containing protein/tetratricopeptide (TPR) repeat protein